MSQKPEDSLFPNDTIASESTTSPNISPLPATSDEDIEANKLRATNLYFAGRPMYDLIPNAAKEPFHLLDHHTLSMHAFDYVHQNLGFGSHEQGGVKKDDLVTRVAHLVEQQLLSLALGNKNHVSRRDIRDYAGNLVDNLLNDVFQSEELAFLNNYRERLRDPRWKMIDSWLLNGGRSVLWTRIKERSLEIFNDEKALDDMRTKNCFFKEGYICVDTLRCSHAPGGVPIPFAIITDSDSNTCIVIENSDTYSTMCQWNLTAKVFRAVAYGGGNAFSSSWEGLATLKEGFGVERFEYFGDVDEDGFNIPYRTGLKMKEQGLHLSLSKDFYALLL